MIRRVESRSRKRIDAEAAEWVARRDTDLSAVDRMELERWLAADPRHRAALQYYDCAWSALAQPARAGAGAELQRQLDDLASHRRHRRMAVGGACLAIMLVLVALGWVRSGSFGTSPMVEAVVVMSKRQTLPDGSVVELKGNARVLPDYTNSLRRVVLERGVAFFSVEKDAARPFIVVAGGVEIQAVGTAFAVQMTSASVEVLVTEGRVAVAKASEASAPQAGIDPAAVENELPEPATVGAGERVRVDLAQSMTMPDVSPIGPDLIEEMLAWRSPRLEFTRTPLSEAIALLNAHAPPAAKKLAVADGKVGAMRVTGIFRADNTESFVLLLEGAFGLRAERAGDIITLHKTE